MIAPLLQRNSDDLASLLPAINALAEPLQQLGNALLAAWAKRAKALTAGNGGSAADAMHLAEELTVRFHKNRKALPAMALLDPTVLTCAGNDFGYEQVFSRQIEAFGNPGDIFIALTSSGNSPNIVKAVETARSRGLLVAGFLGKDGGLLKGRCDIELLVPSSSTARVQEAHKLLFHTLCEWIDSKVD
jgi:D-sedoheptulose 7-phosphate isomerase